MTSEDSSSLAPDIEIDVPLASDGIYVCSLTAVPHMIDHTNATHLVTLINHNTMLETPEEIHPENHLKLAMNDIVEPQLDLVLPNESHVSDLIGFVENWPQTSPLLIHCWAGISRSTAAAFIALCQLNPEHDESEIYQHMRKLSPTAYPNRRLIDLADEQLQRNGRMGAAVEALGRGEMAMEGVIFGLSADLSTLP